MDERLKVVTNPMTLQQSVLTWWDRLTRVPESQASVAPRLGPTPNVPVEYLSLHAYLEHRYATTVVLTFEQMESLLGFALPEPARSQPDWWTAAASSRDRHPHTWTAAGRTATPNLLAGTVAFERPL
jgi:hypothetical protein